MIARTAWYLILRFPSPKQRRGIISTTLAIIFIIRHVGPMAQDFHSTFGLGHDELRITTMDADGILFALSCSCISVLWSLRMEYWAQLLLRPSGMLGVVTDSDSLAE